MAVVCFFFFGRSGLLEFPIIDLLLALFRALNNAASSLNPLKQVFLYKENSASVNVFGLSKN
jgi:hypothetical protein